MMIRVASLLMRKQALGAGSALLGPSCLHIPCNVLELLSLLVHQRHCYSVPPHWLNLIDRNGRPFLPLARWKRQQFRGVRSGGG